MKAAILAAVMVIALFASHAIADDLDECAFNKTSGTCSATFSLNRETNTYTIPPSGSCRTVTIHIDSTQYAHRQFRRSIVDNVMVLQKGKPYSFGVSGCTSHPHKQEVLDQCRANTPRCPKSETLDHAKACWSQYADAFNSCVGARAMAIDWSVNRDGSWKIWAKSLDF